MCVSTKHLNAQQVGMRADGSLELLPQLITPPGGHSVAVKDIEFSDSS